MSRFSRPFARVAAVLALFALGLALSACGRKGPLDPPPGAYVGPGGALVEVDSQGRPIAPPGEKKRIPLDVLLD